MSVFKLCHASALRTAIRRERKGFAGLEAFTLVEILVCLVALLLIVVLVASMASMTSSIWHRTVGTVGQFRAAQDAFESITRRLSQATLNTYWDYDNPSAPTKYIRQSELRFISGSGIAGSGTATPPRPTHSIFFQAPMGFVVSGSAGDATYQTYQGMENLLNTWGYYVEYGSDVAFRPTFLTSQPQTRFRLMEYMESSPSLSLYWYEAQAAAIGTTYHTNLTSPYSGMAWFLGNGPGHGVNGVNESVAGAGQYAPVHILAENVIALILLPKLTPATEAAQNYTDSSLAPSYLYDSTGDNMTTTTDPNLNPVNQLPPIVQVTMVAIDEASAVRLTAQGNQNILNELNSLFSNSTNYSTDLAGGGTTPPVGGGLEPFLSRNNISYRVFSTDVAIKGAKWSSYQSQ